ncbi:MAG: Stk1 family PASTA domain-containing Ser/Thr kinase [Actinobacteria bacterium]|nr:Stk1 family PASTA domain-containing Ser/Thr kinase [Actinomycetota bacterium]
MIGNIIADRYKIINKIGSGGTADVYLAWDGKLNRYVAIKILSKTYASEKNFVARFKKEAQILARLNDPNIVAIYDWGQYDNSYFICMEYAEGQSLEEIIDKQGIISPEVTARYAIQICSALEVAHKNNLIHRDIKPQNIIVTPDGTVKITDFGIAKSLIEDNTKTINILGTAYYISPEQAQGKILSYSTDIYSLGVVLYEMLTADLPFRGENSIEISLKHINEKPIRPSALVSNIPPEIEKILMHCIEKNPQKRYENVSVLKADLQNFLNKKPLLIEKQQEREKSLYGKSIINKITFLKREPKHLDGYSSFPKEDSEEEPPEKNKKKFRLSFTINLSIAYFLAAVFLTLFIIFTINYSDLKASQNILAVPQVEKMFFENAKAALALSDLELEKKSESFSEDVPQNYIISQEPKAGTQIAKGSMVEAVVSKGKEISPIVAVPNLIGLNISDATKIINEASLKISDTLNEPSDFFEPGIVTFQDPPPGKEIKINEAVKLKISSGKNIVMVPNIIGYDYLYVISQLEAMGLNVNIKRVPSTDSLPGKVLRISPEAGTKVKEGDLISIYIATTEQMILLPDVTQLSVDKAVSILQSLNILYDISNIEAQYDIQKNLVMSQYPDPDTYISIGEKVLLLIGK